MMILNIYKEKGWTSFDVVAKVRSIMRNKSGGKKIKVGHAGTLDPLAEGVLIVLVGTDTKKQNKFMEEKKEYLCEISFGAVSKTYDLEGELEYREIPKTMEIEKEVNKLLPKFMGEIEQTVPPFSAAKVKGKKLYESARKGKIDFDLPVKHVVIYELEKLGFYKKNDLETIKLRILCSKGTYIRSLANDLGELLGIGAVLTGLVRTKIGHFEVEDSVRINDLEKKLES